MQTVLKIVVKEKNSYAGPLKGLLKYRTFSYNCTDGAYLLNSKTVYS